MPGDLVLTSGGTVNDAVLRHQNEVLAHQFSADGNDSRVRRKFNEVIVVSDQASRDVGVIDAAESFEIANFSYLPIVNDIDLVAN